MPSTSGLMRILLRGLFIPASLILVVQATAVRKLWITERDIPIPGLSQVPTTLGAWKSQGEMALDPASAEVLKPDDYIMRDYTAGNTGGNTGGNPGENIGLFVAHFKSLQDSYGPHSPRICLPGAGWLIASSKVESIPVLGPRRTIPVNEYVLDKSGARILAVYWYQNNRDVWAEEFQAKLRFLPDLIRYRRSDESLVRLITSVTNGDRKAALDRCLDFAKVLFPPLTERFAVGE